LAGGSKEAAQLTLFAKLRSSHCVRQGCPLAASTFALTLLPL